MNSDAYFLAVNGQQTGPFSLAQVQEMWKAGMVSAQTLSWCKGEADWQPLGNLASVFAGAPVPPPMYPAAAPGTVMVYDQGTIVPGYPPSTSGLAITSFILGLMSFVCFFTCLPAVIFGHLALSQIKRSSGWLGGRGFAMAGLVMGYFYIGISALFLLMILVLPIVAAIADPHSVKITHSGTASSVISVMSAEQDLSNAKQIGLAVVSYENDHDHTTPPNLEALFPGYLTDRSVLVSPLGQGDQSPGYDLLTPGVKADRFDPGIALLRGRFTTDDHQRAYVYADGRAERKNDP